MEGFCDRRQVTGRDLDLDRRFSAVLTALASAALVALSLLLSTPSDAAERSSAAAEGVGAFLDVRSGVIVRGRGSARTCNTGTLCHSGTTHGSRF